MARLCAGALFTFEVMQQRADRLGSNSPDLLCWVLRPAHTTLDTLLLRLVVLLYCLRLCAASPSQAFGLLGRVSGSKHQQRKCISVSAPI